MYPVGNRRISVLRLGSDSKTGSDETLAQHAALALIDAACELLDTLFEAQLEGLDSLVFRLEFVDEPPNVVECDVALAH